MRKISREVMKMKKIFAALLALCLVPALPCRAQERQPLPVVMYHHVSKNPSQWNDYVVSPEELESDLRYFRDNGWQSVSVAQLVSWSRGEWEMPEKPFMITFDDGFESTLAYAEPLLEEYGFCAGVAVIGSVCTRFSQLDEHYPELSNMSWEDAAQLSRRGTVEVQCHTWDMHSLSPRRGCSRMPGESTEHYDAALRADLQKFLDAAEENGVSLTMSLAFPYGEYCEQAQCILRDMGFLASFTCDERVNLLERDPDALFGIARYNRPHGAEPEMFYKKWESALDNAG